MCTILFFRWLPIFPRQRDIRIEVPLMIWVGIWNGIRTQRVAVLNISFDIVVPVDEHRPEDLILILCLVLLTVPMIHGKRTHSKRDHLLYNVCPSAIGVVLVLLPSHSLGPKAVIVASGAKVIQV